MEIILVLSIILYSVSLTVAYFIYKDVKTLHTKALEELAAAKNQARDAHQSYDFATKRISLLESKVDSLMVSNAITRTSR